MELRLLQYFLAVAQQGSITGAAQVLHLTQPTLSRQMLDLEDELGKTLFLRGKRNITLTDEGLLLRKRAEAILELVDKTVLEFNDSTEQFHGTVYIGCAETDDMRLIAKTACSLRRDYPHILYSLISGNARRTVECLDNDLLDFAVLIEPEDITKYEYLQLPFIDTWGLLVAQNHPLSQCSVIRPEQMTGLPLICSQHTLLKNKLSAWLGYNYEKLNVVATYNLLFPAALLAEAGYGSVLCLDKALPISYSNNLLFIPLDPPLRANLYIVWKKYRLMSRVAGTFLGRLQEILADGYKQ